MEALLEKEGDVESWNDERMDELSRRVDGGFKETRDGFARVDREMKEGFIRVDREMKEGFIRVDCEMKAGFARVDREMKEGFARVDSQFDRVNDRLDKTNYLLTASALGLVATLIATLVAPTL
jgi:hypothetical protein